MTLQVAFLWHLHQPYYVDPLNRSFLMPWVRLHATKDYLFLAEIFRKYPGIAHNVNFVPSLLEQIELYNEGSVEDISLTLSKKKAFDLTLEEKIFIIENFFNAPERTMIHVYPRFREIHQKWKEYGCDSLRSAKNFGLAEITDLQLLYNLAWTNPYIYRDRKDVQDLVTKGRSFNEKDKDTLFSFHAEVLSRIAGEFKNLSKEGRVEMTVSPYFHPILPLLIDSNSAFEADPGLPDPGFRIGLKKDAELQIEQGLRYFSHLFDTIPTGIWPPEGSVSDETLNVISRKGLQYGFTDELILKKSAMESLLRDDEGIPESPEILYRPYLHEQSGLRLFFRDHFLSDLVGFVYKNWTAESSASHMVDSLLKIRDKLIKRGFNPNDHIVSIILDGENPWEHYDNYGIDFLDSLFSELSDCKELNVTRFIDYMSRPNGGREGVLQSVKSGSWIDGTFGIWFSHEEDFRAWKRIDDFYSSLFINKVEEFRDFSDKKHILCAEGSDWFWWYGDEHFTNNLKEFDILFRNNVKTAYADAGIKYPKNLDEPIFDEHRIIQGPRGEGIDLKPNRYIYPKIDGILTEYYEWTGSARFIQTPKLGSMHRSGHGMVKEIHAGFNRENFYIRIDLTDSMFISDFSLNISITLNDVLYTYELSNMDSIVNLKTIGVKKDAEASFHKIFEFSTKIEEILSNAKGKISFYINLKSKIFEERWPEDGRLSVNISGFDPEREEWIV